LAAETGLLTLWFIIVKIAIAAPLMLQLPLLRILLAALWSAVKVQAVIEARMVVITLPVILVLAVLWLWY
jgi:hypothetical protein